MPWTNPDYVWPGTEGEYDIAMTKKHIPSTYKSLMKHHAIGPNSHGRFIYALEFAEYLQDNYGYNIYVTGHKCGDVYYGWDERNRIKVGPGFLLSVRIPRRSCAEEKYFPVKVTRETMAKSYEVFAMNVLIGRIPDNLRIPGWEHERA